MYEEWADESKSKVIVFERESTKTVCNIVTNDEYLKQVDEFVCLGSMFTRDGKTDKDIEEGWMKETLLTGDRMRLTLTKFIKKAEAVSPPWSAHTNPDVWQWGMELAEERWK